MRRFEGEARLAVLYVRKAHPGAREPPHRDAEDKLRRAAAPALRDLLSQAPRVLWYRAGRAIDRHRAGDNGVEREGAAT